MWGDLAELDYGRAEARAGLIEYWGRYLRHYVGLGVKGFRCDAAYQVPAEVWKSLIDSAREVDPEVTFCAETLGYLSRIVDGEIAPKGRLLRIPALLPSFNMRTTDGPMAEMAELAAAWRSKPGILDATVFGGFAYGDSPFAGPKASRKEV